MTQYGQTIRDPRVPHRPDAGGADGRRGTPRAREVGPHGSGAVRNVPAPRDSDTPEQDFRALAENAPGMIARLDRDHRYVYVNPAVEDMTGLPASEILGKTNRELRMPEELSALWEARLNTERAAGPLLTREAMANGDPNRIADRGDF